jgi:TPR repeat protein
VRSFLIFCLLAALLFPVSAQKAVNSPALKSYRTPQAPDLVRPYNENQKFWKEFMLVRDANAGDASAQHELGLRYLLGEGFFADTAKAAYWIGKAAEQRLPSACFNFGILLNNGWGVPWNPFTAYANIQFAAYSNITEARYALGLFLLDNLTVPRNDQEAYCLVRAAADSGYTPAIELLLQLEKRNIGTSSRDTPGEKAQKGTTSVTQQQHNKNFGLIFLDFTQDTASHVDETMLAQDIMTMADDTALTSGILPQQFSDDFRSDTAAVRRLQQLADEGSPEALTMMGWLHQQGLLRKKDYILATVYYLRASRFDSPRAPELLWKLTQEKEYFKTLQAGIEMNDSNAMFAWAGLIAMGFDHQLTEQQALQMLRSAINFHNEQAMIELGICYFTGRWVNQSKEFAMEWWSNAAKKGNREAAIRILASNILSTDRPVPSPQQFSSIQNAAAQGSIQAQLALAFALETGRGLEKNDAEAVRLYRKAAQRGSRVAYESLRRMYDFLRPTSDEFIVPD